MGEDAADLATVKQLLLQFYTVNNAKNKRELESRLEGYRNRADSWRKAVYFIENCRDYHARENQYMLWFAFSILEHALRASSGSVWAGIDAENRAAMKSLMWQFLMNSSRCDLPAFVVNKMIVATVLLGKLEWPHTFPEFLPAILLLIKDPGSCVLGCKILICISEEFKPSTPSLIGNRGDASEHIQNSLGDIFSCVDVFLQRGYALVRAGTENEEVERIMVGIPFGLNVILSFLSWAPLSPVISVRVLETLFSFCMLPIASQMEHRDGELANDFGTLAVQCLMEIIQKKYVPNEFQGTLDIVIRESYKLLKQLSCLTVNKKKPGGDVSSVNSSFISNALDDIYTERILSYFSAIVSNHLERLISGNGVTLMEFLESFFHFTFSFETSERYLVCLEVWVFLLDSILEKVKGGQRKGNGEADRICLMYKDAFLSLGNSLCKKIQFSSNSSMLNELDDESLFDEGEKNEFDHFIHCNIECISKVAELYPGDVITSLFPHLVQLTDSYMTSHEWWNQNNENMNSVNVNVPKDSKLRLMQKSSEEARHLLYQIRDTEITLLLFSSFSSIFCDNFSNTLDACLILIDRLYSVCVYGITYQMYMNDKYLLSLQKQCFASLSSFAYWIYLYCCEYQQSKEVSDLMSSILDLIFSVLTRNAPESLMASAAESFNFFSLTVRHKSFGTLPKISKFAIEYPSICTGVPVGIQKLVFKGIVNVFVLPWQGVSDGDQNWQARKEIVGRTCDSLTGPLLQLMDSVKQDSRLYGEKYVKELFANTFEVLTSVIECVFTEPKTSKTIIFNSTKSAIEPSLSAFQVYIGDPVLMNILLKFYSALFEGLKQQLGSQDTQSIISCSFSQFFTPEIIVQSMAEDSESAKAAMVLNFIKILKLVVNENSQVFKTFLGTIIEMSVEQIYPTIKQCMVETEKGAVITTAGNAGLDIYQEYYSLLHAILLNHIRFFYPRIGSISDNDLITRRGYFVKILMAFAESFSLAEISLFKQNLAYLEELNVKCNLYRKDVFLQEHFMYIFIEQMMTTLMEGSHNLLKEEIISFIYSLASIEEFRTFFNEFVPRFVQTKLSSKCTDAEMSQLCNCFPRDTDLPSFAKSLDTFTRTCSSIVFGF
eukprot:Nk52_evm64s1810 gene=Nk52_evmTU64s1810